jgi:uncharacterized membrane protein (DUF4010 family)
MSDATGLVGIAVAAIGGLAVGLERQRTGHASGRFPRLGGIRTFTLLGGAAGFAGWLTTIHFAALGIVLTAGAVALVIAGYVAASRHEVDATTEAAALVVIAAGIAAGIGWLALASGAVAVCILLLVEKSDLHALARRIDDEEMRAAARFAVMAIVILPLLPEGPLDRLGGIRPRQLWLLVLLFSGLSFLGYLARRLLGAKQGYPVAGLIGGLISSTSVTYTFARQSRREEALSQPLAAGAIGACTMLFPRVFVAASVLNPAVGWALLPYIGPPFVMGVIAFALWWRKSAPSHSSAAGALSNPLQIGQALQMAVVFQVVLFAVDAIRRYADVSGLFATGALLGLTDVDALTISMTTVIAPHGQHVVAAQAIAVGILANSLLKIGLAAVLGTRQYGRVTGAFVGAMAVAIVISFGVVR